MQPISVAFLDHNSGKIESKKGFGSVTMTEKTGIAMDKSA